MDHYLAILERLFLIRSLQNWHRRPAKRLIKTPKVHLVDSGLAATHSDLTAGDWLGRRDRMGHLLETFVVQQIVGQAAWTDQDLRFWHYRDKDPMEVDLVITRGEKVWGVEVKASRSVNAKDGRSLDRLADQCDKHSKAAASSTTAGTSCSSAAQSIRQCRCGDCGRSEGD